MGTNEKLEKLHVEMKKYLDILDSLKIIYCSISLLPTFKDKKPVFDEYNHLKKTPDIRFKYQNIALQRLYNDKMNSCIIPTGIHYDNLILIDIDNKNDSVKLWEKLCKKNNFDGNTLTLKTMNNGLHYYFYLSDEQAKAANETLTAINGRLWKNEGLFVDVKYTNQFGFGPSFMIVNGKSYTYNIIKNVKPNTLPDFIFDEIQKCMKDKPKNETKKTGSKIQEKTQTKTVQSVVEIQKGKGFDQFGFPESDNDKPRARTKSEIEKEIEKEIENGFKSDSDDDSENESKKKSRSESESELKCKSKEKSKEKSKDIVKNKSKSESEGTALVKHSKKSSVVRQKTAEEIIEKIEEEIKQKEKEEKFANLTINDYVHLLKLLNKSRADNYQDWIEIGQIFKNESTSDITNEASLLNLWETWSKQSNKYEKGECGKKWKSFKKQKTGLRVGTLIMKVKEDSIQGYDDFKDQNKFKQIIEAHKDSFPNNELAINNVYLDRGRYIASLEDKYCEISKETHEGQDIYLEFCKQYGVCMKCHRPECRHKQYPENCIQLTQQQNLTLFKDCQFYINSPDNKQIEHIEHIDFETVRVFEDKELNTIIFNTLNIQTEGNLARLIYYLYKNKYNCENDTWYEFIKHKWKKIKTKYFSLRHIAANELQDYFKRVIEFYKNTDYNQKKINKINKFLEECDQTHMKDNILKELTEVFNINNKGEFIEKLDSNPNLIGFENGIYDLEKMEFRDGKPDDYITMSVGYNYEPQYSNKKIDIMKFFEDIMPNEQQREYLLTLCGSCLFGSNTKEQFYIFTGAMRNGKTTLTTILKYTFGDYYTSAQNNMFTEKRASSGAAQPDVMKLIKKRIVVTSETENQQKLNTGFIKGITGADDIEARTLYSNDIVTFIPTFKLLMLCNDIPEVDKPTDPAFWNRARCVYFPTTFVEDPKEPNERKINEHLKENIKSWRNDCMLLFIEYYIKFLTNGLQATPEIKISTQKYKNENDFYGEYVTIFLKNTHKDEDYIEWTDLRSRFCNWYYDNVNKNAPNIKSIKQYFIKNIFKCDEVHFKRDKKEFRGWKEWNLKEI